MTNGGQRDPPAFRPATTTRGNAGCSSSSRSSRRRAGASSSAMMIRTGRVGEAETPVATGIWLIASSMDQTMVLVYRTTGGTAG